MNERVLIVDDDENFRYAITRLLADAGFETVEAANYSRALEVLEDGQPLHLLLTDLVLPGLNGFALARMARMRHLDLKVVYVTAYDVPTSEAVGPVLRKPVQIGDLLAAIRNVLGGGDPRYA